MSVVCVWEAGGGGGGGWGGENVRHAVHAALGGCVVVCVWGGGGGRSRGSHAINTHTAQKQ